MTDERRDAWLVFSIQETDAEGVEVSKLSRLLDNLSSTFYAIARAKTGITAGRPGPRTTAEEALAAVRLVRVTPGSTTIELAPPAVDGQGRLPILEETTPDDVALEIYEEIRRIQAGEPVTGVGWDIRRRVRELIADAGAIGSSAEIVYRPVRRRPTFPSEHVLTARIQLRALPEEVPPQPSSRRRRLSGHAYMVDVEPGRQRLRIKLPDGRDLTLDASQELITRIRDALDRVVELEVEEELEGEAVTSRMAHSVDILPSSGAGSDKPPKSTRQLEREQGLPEGRPDYGALASAIWETEQDVEEFEGFVRQIRHAETS